MGSERAGADDIMSIALFQKEILAAARIAVKNPDLKMRDILEWSIGEVTPCDGEVVVGLDCVGCNICILKTNDHRANAAELCPQTPPA
jgi:high-affinity K+ transport system ATPase subunit B